jgi:hypothetical protein
MVHFVNKSLWQWREISISDEFSQAKSMTQRWRVLRL